MTKPHQLGDAPIEPAMYEHMNAIAEALDETLNPLTHSPHKRGVIDKRKVGFVLLVFPLRSHEGRCNYISNGADRDDIVTLFKEQIKRFEGQPETEGHA